MFTPFLEKQNHGWKNRAMAGKTEPWLEKQSHGWKNRTMAGKTEPWLGKQNHGWENRTMAGKTEPWLEKQNHGWRNRIMAGKTEPWLGILIVRCVFVFFCAFLWLILPKKKRQSRFPGTAANGLQLYVQMNVLLSI